MSTLKSVWQKLKPYLTLKKLGVELEPARVTSVLVGLAAVGALLGVTIPTSLSPQLVTALGVIVMVLHLLAGEAIRSKVTPTATVLSTRKVKK